MTVTERERVEIERGIVAAQLRQMDDRIADLGGEPITEYAQGKMVGRAEMYQDVAESMAGLSKWYAETTAKIEAVLKGKAA